MIQNDNPVLHIVSDATGEIIDELHEGDRIVRGNSTDYLNQTIEMEKDKRFLKIYDTTFSLLADEPLTGNQWRIIATLSTHFQYGSGLVAFSNGVPLTPNHICQLTNVSRSTVFDTLDILVKKRILAKTKVGNDVKYFINPYLFCRGNRINKTLHSMFKDSKWYDRFISE